MQPLTPQGQQKITELSQRYGVSTDAVMAMLQAVVNGNGTMAQFYINELGGGGQWMLGGMTMVGDMFNYGLKSKVDGLCGELSQLLSQQPFTAAASYPSQASHQPQWQGGQQQGAGSYSSGGYSSGGVSPDGYASGGYESRGSSGGGGSLFVPGSFGGSASWWPGDLGSPNGSGGQNNIRYAYFSNARRLAVQINGTVTVYDTLDHQIGGVSQQQSGSGSLTLTSQYGTVDIASLPVVSVNGQAAQGNAAQSNFAAAAPYATQPPTPSAPAPASYAAAPYVGPSQAAAAGPHEADIFAKIERLAELQQKGILSQDEFAAKKTELLSRL